MEKKKEMNFENSKMNELKEKCRYFNLKMTGKRENLVNRLKKFHFLQTYTLFRDMDNFTSYKSIANNRIVTFLKVIQVEKDSNLYKTFNTFTFYDQKKYFIVWDSKKEKFIKKMSLTKKIVEFTREDLHFLKSIHLDFEIPPQLSGEALCSRNPIDESDDEDEVYCDFE